ncbi:MAG: hypothetical protein KME10_10620 [Plectolyngbya sp. WJT66-NPBG17]|jgi:hypothetical protein|nr:hypothetical protein [Plectolyngbya sp. WJT66-NPBG17]
MFFSNSEPIRIFIGSSPRNLIEEQVFCHTLLKHASQPLEIYSIDGLTGSAQFGQSVHPELGGIDHHDGGETGRHWVPQIVLTVEATKLLVKN